nr:MAG TPA: hypothetical protein [Bacteriophage sp.]
MNGFTIQLQAIGYEVDGKNTTQEGEKCFTVIL